MDLMGLAIVVVLVIFAYRYIDGRRPKKRERRELTELMEDCNGDQDLVERLIFAEMENHPNMDFKEAARRARARLSRDRR